MESSFEGKGATCIAGCPPEAEHSFGSGQVSQPAETSYFPASPAVRVDHETPEDPRTCQKPLIQALLLITSTSSFTRAELKSQLEAQQPRCSHEDRAAVLVDRQTTASGCCGVIFCCPHPTQPFMVRPSVRSHGTVIQIFQMNQAQATPRSQRPRCRQRVERVPLPSSSLPGGLHREGQVQ